MMKAQIKQLLETELQQDGLVNTHIKGVQLFRVSESIRCAPAVYEPTIIAILSGSKEAILDGHRHIYDSSQYMCCTMTMPVEAGTPAASPENPLIGMSISLDTKVMTELAIELDSTPGEMRSPNNSSPPKGFTLSNWDSDFSEALLRLLLLNENPTDAAILSGSRLRELYYVVMKGQAGPSIRRAFGIGNEISRAIEYLSSRLAETVTIDDIASKVGMSRAVFHRKFKQATNLSPIQFVKAMRLNTAAMKIANGTKVNNAALEVGYVSSSQFSREFKRMYGQSPKQWSQSKPTVAGLT